MHECLPRGRSVGELQGTAPGVAAMVVQQCHHIQGPGTDEALQGDLYLPKSDLRLMSFIDRIILYYYDKIVLFIVMSFQRTELYNPIIITNLQDCLFYFYGNCFVLLLLLK